MQAQQVRLLLLRLLDTEARSWIQEFSFATWVAEATLLTVGTLRPTYEYQKIRQLCSFEAS